MLIMAPRTARMATAVALLLTVAISPCAAQSGEIEVFRIAWIAHCKVTHAVLGSPAHPLRTKQTHITLTAHGTWSVSGTYTASSGNGYTEKFRVSDHGTMTKKGTVRGSFKGTAKIYRASKNGAYVDTCTSGKVTFTLK